MKPKDKLFQTKKTKQSLLRTLSPNSSLKKIQCKKYPSLKKIQNNTQSLKQQSIKCNLFNIFTNKSYNTNPHNISKSTKNSQDKIKTQLKNNPIQPTSIYSKNPQKPTYRYKLPNNKPTQKHTNNNNNTCINKLKQQIKKSLINVIKIYHPQQKSYLDISMIQNTNNMQIKQSKLQHSDFNFIHVIGIGGYGKVWKVQYFKSKTIYAIKQMSKAVIIIKKSVDNVINQMKILSQLNHPFIANMAFAFNDRDNLYLGMDYLPGGDIRSYINQSPPITQQHVKFLIACIIKATQYIHSNKIFHRDIKPQNLVIDELGYIRLTDFGIARSHKQKQYLDASGTPSYMAPEVLCKQMHSYSVDLYAIGIITYELIMGKRPYSGQNRQQIRNAILAKQHLLKKQDLPPMWSIQSSDFVNQLIQRQPNLRLGYKKGIQQLKQHSWFYNYPWKLHEQKKLISPFIIKPLNINHINKQLQYDQSIQQYQILKRIDFKIDVFSGYFFYFR